MKRFKTAVKKIWIFVAAAALLAGSSTAMAFALDYNLPKSVSQNVAPYAAVVKEDAQSQDVNTEDTPEYTVVDLSKNRPENKDLIFDKLSHIEGITPEQIQEKYDEIIANTIPGEKDITAQQAAAYAADILKKAYKVDFKGYTAEASFSRNPVPYFDNWTVVFHAPEDVEKQDPKRVKSYLASVDSVTGRMLDASSYDQTYETDISKSLEDPAWVSKGEQLISALMPQDVSITGSKVVFATPESGVTIVYDLSDGSACAVRLTGDNKEAAAYIYFPNGYDGSLDYHPVTENSVG